ncbi:MAG: hypothetical protein ACOZB3_11920 [Calditrichota bacterium]
MKVSRTFLIITLAITLWALNAVAAGIEFKPYGFIKGDAWYTTHGVLSFTKPGLSGPQMADADTTDEPLIGFTSQHSRFGLTGWKATESGVEIGGKVEMDFFTGAGLDANAKPRLRLAYAWFATKLFEIRAGQQWDLFSPNNPATDNIGGNLWYNGNVGFRRSQLQFILYIPEETTAPMVQLALCESAKEVDGLGQDNLAAVPMIQGRGSIEVNKKYQVGLYFVYAKYDPDQKKEDDEYSTSGFGADFDLRFHKLISVKGELNSGTNLNNSNLLTAVGNGSKDNDRKNLGFWMNAVTKPTAHFNFSLGFGMDKNETDADKIAPGGFEQNMCIYGDFIFPVSNGLSFEAEISNVTTSRKDIDDESALIFGFGTKLSF